MLSCYRQIHSRFRLVSLSLLWFRFRMDSQPSRHVVLEDTPSDSVPPPILPVQMSATQTLHTISHYQAAVIPPIVTPVTIIEDCSRMDRLERRIR